MNITSSLASILNSSPRAQDALVRKGNESQQANQVALEKVADKSTKGTEKISAPSLADTIHKLSLDRVMSLLDPESRQPLNENDDVLKSLVHFPPAGASEKLLSAWENATQGFEGSTVFSLQIDFSIEQVLANVKQQAGMIIGEHKPGEKEFRDIFSEKGSSFKQVSERVMVRLEIAREFGSVKVEEFSMKKLMIENFQQQLDTMGVE